MSEEIRMKTQRGSGCGCNTKLPMMLGGGCSSCELPAMRGGGGSCAATMEGFQGCPMTGGGATQPGTYIQLASTRVGGYKATKKNRTLLRRWRKGQRIGFTATSSLKAKGLIPRTSKKYKGKRIVSNKYK